MTAGARPIPSSAKPRRGRPTAGRAARIDDTILDVALAVFLERGFEGATIESVAERAGVSKGTVYARFPGKDALFRKVMEHTIAMWSAQAGQFDHLMPDDLAGRLRYHLGTMHRMFGAADVLRFTRLVEQASDSFPDIAAFWVETGMHRYRELLTRSLAEANRSSGKADWRFIAELVANGFCNWLRTESLMRMPGDDEVEAFIEKLVDAVLRLTGQPPADDEPKENCK